ncbi:MAG TPA: Rid family hydrolase [Polyangiaceae bacterium]|nr:Rid family hydrolase [Polyangiaceae bacterium]
MTTAPDPLAPFDPGTLSAGARDELERLGLLSPAGAIRPAAFARRAPPPGVAKRTISAPAVLSDARAYGSAFPRGLRLDFGGLTLILISGTASVDEEGRTVHPGDFAAQCFRTYRNIAALLAAEGATWHDVVRTTCYLANIERDYAEFNRIRSSLFAWMGLDPLPASVGVQARLCRGDLLIEIEAMALLPGAPPAGAARREVP